MYELKVVRMTLAKSRDEKVTETIQKKNIKLIDMEFYFMYLNF